MHRTSTAADRELPPVFDPIAYRLHNQDLNSLTDAAIAAHYELHGESEGRLANSIASREDFVALIPGDADALEIGPFHNPLLSGGRAKFFDVLSRDGLLERARLHGLSGDRVPAIDFVSADGDLAVVSEQFDYVLSSHCIEHQPDLIRHLRNVGSILRDGGRYMLLIPDKRFCFDHFIAESSIADVFQAHESKRSLHLLKSVIEHRVLSTHNDCVRHWAGDHGVYLENAEARLRSALAEHAGAQGGYLDVHAWYFTPQSARQILSVLYALGVIALRIERLYPTRFNTNEFWMVLQK